jgi:hypothetical protein
MGGWLLRVKTFSGRGVVKNRLAAIWLISLLLIVLVSCQKQETWKGSIETKDGVSIVKNPKDPMYGEDAFSLEEELAIGGSGGDEEAMLARPFSLVVDDGGNIYVLDIQAGNIKKFSSDGRLITSISRKGQGPGELQGPLSVQMAADNELLVDCVISSRLVYFTPDGTFLRETHLTKIPRALIMADGHGDFICQYPESGPIFKVVLAKFSSDQEKLFQIAEVDPRYSEIYFPFAPGIISNVTSENNIVWAVTDKYEIMIADPQGRLIRRISRDYVPVEVTEAEKEELIKRQGPPDQGAKIPAVYPPLQSEFPTSDEAGRIFIKTYEKAEDGVSFFFDAFDAAGRYLARIPLKQVRRVPPVWKNGKLYTIEEDESGFNVVKRYKVTWRD